MLLKKEINSKFDDCETKLNNAFNKNSPDMIKFRSNNTDSPVSISLSLSSSDIKLKHPNLIPTQNENAWSIPDNYYAPIKYTSKEVIKNPNADIDLLI